MKTKPCGLEVEEVSIIAFKNLRIHQLFVTAKGITMIKVSDEEAVVLSTGLPQQFGTIEFNSLNAIKNPIEYSRMDEPVLQAMFIE